MKSDRPEGAYCTSGVGHRLRMAREMTQLGPERAWREAGVPPRLLEMYERGAIPIRGDHLSALAACMDIPVAWLRCEDAAVVVAGSAPA